MPTHPHILVAMCEQDAAMTVAHFLETEGAEVERCADEQGVIRLVGRRDFAVIVLDLSLIAGGDMDVLTFIRRQSPETQIILLFEMEEIGRAIDGIRRGAYFYLPRNSQPSDVALAVSKAIQESRIRAAAAEHERFLFEEFAGASPAMRRVIELINKVAPTDSTVLLLGESGVGKEVMANTIHRLSPRNDRPFVAINCAALPEEILESELFGHVKGAFTGAVGDKLGLFESADGGTLFLDEIGDLPLVSQAKLLRVLQGGEIRRVGGNEIDHVDVRVLAATNSDLLEDVREKRFREDLYFRLNVIRIEIPPLRERPDAIASLTRQFLKRFNARFNKAVFDIEPAAWSLIESYAYPGNVRELESVIAHAIILADGTAIRVQDLPDTLRFGGGARLGLPDLSAGEAIPTIQDMERQLIESTLERLEGNQTEVAKALGISRSTLWRKMKEYGLSKDGD